MVLLHTHTHAHTRFNYNKTVICCLPRAEYPQTMLWLSHRDGHRSREWSRKRCRARCQGKHFLTPDQITHFKTLIGAACVCGGREHPVCINQNTIPHWWCRVSCVVWRVCVCVLCTRRESVAKFAEHSAPIKAHGSLVKPTSRNLALDRAGSHIRVYNTLVVKWTFFKLCHKVCVHATVDCAFEFESV